MYMLPSKNVPCQQRCTQTGRGWKKILHAHGNKKQAEGAVLILNQIDFKNRTVNEEGHYVMIKGSM